MSTVTVTFVQATFDLRTYVNISNTSAVTELILTKLQSLLSVTIFNRCQLQQWHLSRQYLTWRLMSISAISQLLLNQFWQNFRFKFSWAFFDRCHITDDICTMNLCPDNICPCPSTKPNIDQSVWTLNLFVSFIPICVWTKIFLEQNIVFIPKFWTKMFFDQNFCSSKVCFLNNFDFLTKRFKIKILSGPTFKLS